MTILDAHLHIWDLQRFHYRWLFDYPALNRDFLPQDIDQSASSVDGMIFVQSGCDPEEGLAEARWVDSLRHEWPKLSGVVAFAPIERGNAVADWLDLLAEFPTVVGVRRIFEGGPYCDASVPSIVDGLAAVELAGLVFDSCISHDQFADLVKLKRKRPGLRMVLDHMGKPPVAAGLASEEGKNWMRNLRGFASEPNTFIKISGLAPEAAGDRPLGPQVGPFIDAAIDCFGAQRAMLGSDWPVSARTTRSVPYGEWFQTVLAHLSLAPAESIALHRGTAQEAYGLGIETISQPVSTNFECTTTRGGVNDER